MPIYPSSIIVQLLTGTSDYFKNLKEQGEIAEKITQITRYGTVMIAGLQGYGVAVGIENAGNLVLILDVFQSYNNNIFGCRYNFFNVAW